VLGPLEIVAEGRALPLKAAKQKTILALLLLHRDEVVSVDRLQEALWQERARGRARSRLGGGYLEPESVRERVSKTSTMSWLAPPRQGAFLDSLRCSPRWLPAA
jgi:hypothetical protein